LADAGWRLAASGSRSEETELARSVDGVGATVDAQLGVQVAHMSADRVHRDEQLGRDFRTLHACRQVAQHAKLGL
jgi:hypothetical protein